MAHDLPSPEPSALSTEEADEFLRDMFGPEGFQSKGPPKTPTAKLVVNEYDLGVEHMMQLAAQIESGEPIGTVQPSLKAIRHTHHRLARLLASGTDEVVAARLCNYSPNRVSILKSDPAFQDILAKYSASVEEEWVDVHKVISGLSLNLLQELQERLDEKPEAFTPAMLGELAKMLMDRSGNGPTANLNVNSRSVVLHSSDIQRIKDEATPTGSTRPLTEADRRALGSPIDGTARVLTAPEGNDVSAESGPPIREESAEPAEVLEFGRAVGDPSNVKVLGQPR